VALSFGNNKKVEVYIMIGFQHRSFASFSALALGTTLILAVSSSMAAELATKVSFRPASAGGPAMRAAPSGIDELVLSAPPREDASEAERIYGPVAEYLTTELGRKVTFRFPGNWGAYQGMMQKGVYDLVFDGAHFTAWRAANTRHTALLKVPGEHIFVVVVNKDNTRITNIKQVAGRRVCGYAPPNLGTLTVLNEFDNPMRQPVIVNVDGWKNIYRGVLEGKCDAAAVPLKKLEQFEKEGGRQTRIVFRGASLPDSALSAGPRITSAEQDKIVRALQSPKGEAITARLRAKYGYNKSFITTNNQEFAGLSSYLKNEWGY
jgi:hypothetical protein